MAEKKKKKRRKKHYFLRLVVIVLLIVGVIMLLNSSVFNLKKIKVEGNNYFTSEQVIERSGAKVGTNLIFDIDKKDIEKALLKDPYVKEVRISRNLPGTLVITVVEREEAAAVPYADSFVITDEDGLVLRTTEVEPKLPLLIGLTIKSMETGKALEVEENSVLNGTLSLIGSMHDSDVFFKKIDISKVMVKAYVYDYLICQGMPEDIEKALSDGTLQNMLYQLYSGGIERGTISVTADTANMAFSPLYE